MGDQHQNKDMYIKKALAPSFQTKVMKTLGRQILSEEDLQECIGRGENTHEEKRRMPSSLLQCTILETFSLPINNMLLLLRTKLIQESSCSLQARINPNKFLGTEPQ